MCQTRCIHVPRSLKELPEFGHPCQATSCKRRLPGWLYNIRKHMPQCNHLLHRENRHRVAPRFGGHPPFGIANKSIHLLQENANVIRNRCALEVVACQMAWLTWYKFVDVSQVRPVWVIRNFCLAEFEAFAGCSGHRVDAALC